MNRLAELMQKIIAGWLLFVMLPGVLLIMSALLAMWGYLVLSDCFEIVQREWRS